MVAAALSLPQAVEAAHRLALDRLTELLRSAVSDREVRMAAAAILRFKPPPPPDPPPAPQRIAAGASRDDIDRLLAVALALPPKPRAVQATPAAAAAPTSPTPPAPPPPPPPAKAADSCRVAPPAPQPPLTEGELAALAHLLPHVRPARFTTKHSPEYWRDVLTRHAPSGGAPPPAAPRSVAA